MIEEHALLSDREFLVKPVSKVPKREEFKPTGITCPEGIWVREASILYLQKENPEGWRQSTTSDAAQSLVHLLLVTPDLEIFSINSYSGDKAPVDRDYLRSRSALQDFLMGFKPFANDFQVSETDGRYYFLNRAQFKNYLKDEPIGASHEALDDQGSLSTYIPPYMQFMLDAVRGLELSPDKRINKEIIINWLNDNWPAELEGKSARLVQTMATFLRRPKDKKGGNTPWEQ